ncbi:cytochrome b-245 light chain-like [Saccoglossus kowalevskii]|uniref:Cytochrome b-245 light chain n=1 Tax=Saccoglossus kowalevskii TaxID=10224 RepID=A0ABM0MXJ8_SACKO|nr:PREDICTED: cytochrome b-245 light chain-like [Saccoglossus kowalevskii]
MGQIEWAMWANEQALASGAIICVGGIIGVNGFTGWEFGVYAIIAGFLICILEYPRSRRVKGSTIERTFQRILNPVMTVGGTVTQNYYVRFVTYMIACVPCAFLLPTLLGGMCLFIASLIYFKAAFAGEYWKPVGVETRKRTITTKPPSRPPPRPPAAASTSFQEEDPRPTDT